MKSIIRPLLVVFIVLSVLTGLVYPMVVTGIGRSVFPSQAAGSIVTLNGKDVGSTLIGQAFSDPKNFWSRPSATSPMANNATSSSGSNLGPLNPALVDAVKGRVAALKAADPDNKNPIPVDLVTASGSGLDPHISLAAANYQVARVAKARGVAADKVQALVNAQAEGKLWGLLGEPRVNVLQLNIALDALH